MKVIGYITTTIVIMVYGSILNGWALSKLWAWFMVTTFGLPSLSIPAAIGVAMVASYLTREIDETKKQDDEKYWVKMLQCALICTVKPLFAICFGSIVKLWL